MEPRANPALAADNLHEIRPPNRYVIQSGGLFPHLSALDNVTLAARFLKRERQWIASRVAELAELVQLPRDALDPAVLLLDEPLGALDPMVRHGLQEDLRRLFQRLKKSVLLVTHDMAEAAFFSQNIVLMRQGKIVQRGSYRDLIDAPAEQFVTDFVKAQRGLHAEALDA